MAPGTPQPRVSCPACSKSLRLTRPATPGRQFACPRCRHRFCPTAPAIIPAPPPPPLPRPLPAPVAAELPPLRGERPWSLLAAVGAFLLLLGGAVALAVGLGTVGGEEPPAPAPAAALANLPTTTDQPPPSRDGPATDRPAPAPQRTDDLPPPAAPPLPAADASPPRLPEDVQKQVNAAIDRGVAWLRNKQLVNGTFDNSHTTGLAALPALTLLECGVKPDDPVVQKAARFVRSHAGKLNVHSETYELSLALLFLDRLGDPADKALIRLIALRLVAGQQPDGGWSYRCPLLNEKEQTDLLTILRMTRPRPLQPIARQPGGAPALRGPVKGEQGGEPGRVAGERGGEAGGMRGQVADGLLPPPRDGKAVVGERPAGPDEARRALAKMPPRVREVPAVKEALRQPGGKPPAVGWGGSDNSNTQFATLALWAALRHDVPVERSLELNVRRFRQYQLPDGSWKYQTTKDASAQGTPAMTGAGLLGLAVGHALEGAGGTGKTRVDDPAVTRGLDALARHVGKPLGADPVRPMAKAKAKAKAKARAKPPARSPINLYFLWTVERVGVLYDVRLMDGKD